jgi:hypothetical protein
LLKHHHWIAAWANINAFYQDLPVGNAIAHANVAPTPFIRHGHNGSGDPTHINNPANFYGLNGR